MKKSWWLGFVAVGLVLLGGSSLLKGQDSIPLPGQSAAYDARRAAMGVCPPFNLLDEDGNVIDPGKGLNADKPYSPKKTCGRCHDYNKITQGYHFQQGKGEPLTAAFKALYPWCTSPGQYGGRW